jgi:hypothetical protein
MPKGLTVPRAGERAAQCTELDATVVHLTKAQDWELLLRVIGGHGMQVLARGGARKVRRWVAAVPAKVAAESPWATYWSAAATLPESPVAARALLTKVWPAFEEHGDRAGQLLCAAAVLETYQFEWTSFRGAQDWTLRLEACLATGVALESPEAEPRVLANWLFARTQILPELEQRRKSKRPGLSRGARFCARSLCEPYAPLHERMSAAVSGGMPSRHRGLIACHRELGHHLAAMTVYRRRSELLTRMLRIQPSSKTVALYQSVRQLAMSQAP